MLGKADSYVGNNVGFTDENLISELELSNLIANLEYLDTVSYGKDWSVVGFQKVKIVNENDTISTFEIQFGDNDTLSALVSYLIGADLLILLSDVDGLYTANPRTHKDAEFVSYVDNIDDVIDMGSSSAGSSVGTGGMSTKLIAGKIATLSGADMIIANSDDLSIIHRIFDGEFKGTVFESNYDEYFDVLGYIEDNYSY